MRWLLALVWLASVGEAASYAGRGLQEVLDEANELRSKLEARRWSSAAERDDLVEGCVERLKVLVQSGALSPVQASHALRTAGVLVHTYPDPPDYDRSITLLTAAAGALAAAENVASLSELRASGLNELIATRAFDLATKLRRLKMERRRTDPSKGVTMMKMMMMPPPPPSFKAVRNALAHELNEFEDLAWASADPGVGSVYCKSAIAALPVLVHFSENDPEVVDELIAYAADRCHDAHARLRPNGFQKALAPLAAPTATTVAKMAAQSRAVSSVYKLEHDLDQLLELSPRFDAHLAPLRRAIARANEALVARAPGALSETDIAAKLCRTFEAFGAEDSLGRDTFNSFLYRAPTNDALAARLLETNNNRPGDDDDDDPDEEGAKKTPLWRRSGVFNAALDVDRLQDDFFASESRVLVIDDLLSPEALEAARRDVVESTVFHNIKLGYLGAYHYDGFSSEIFLRIGALLPRLLPRIFDTHEVIVNMWAYKYIGESTGIAIHADAAAVNVNVWLTPDEANIGGTDKKGGLVIFKTRPPADWGFDEYNADTAKTRALLAVDAFANVTVPYRANRAVIFDSMLFHKTDAYDFRKTHRGRRVNLTFLYGKLHAVHEDDDDPKRSREVPATRRAGDHIRDL